MKWGKGKVLGESFVVEFDTIISKLWDNVGHRYDMVETSEIYYLASQ